MFEIQTGDMPARNPRRAFKSHARPKPTRKPRRDLSKFRAKGRRVPRPLSAGSAPRVYRFNRGFTNTIALGTANNANRFYVNTDKKYVVVKLAVEFNRLTEYSEFNSLFSEYKIDSWTTTWTPDFSVNLGNVLNPSTASIAHAAIPNYEIITVPARTINSSDYETLSGSQIDDYLNQTQRMTKKLTPGGVLRFKTSQPKTVRAMGPIAKASTVETYSMGGPYWLSTHNGLTPDTTDVSHFGQTLLIRRVDGGAIDDTATQQMSYRVTTRVNFACRKVQ